MDSLRSVISCYRTDRIHYFDSGRLVAHIINPSEFWRSHVIPSLSADPPPSTFYWRGSVWAPWLYHTIKGLEARGFESLAHQASIHHVENLVQVLKWTGTIWENYSPDLPIPGIPAKPDFVGWSGLGPIALLIENILGIRTRAPSDSILWDIRLAERHGITYLRFCNNTVSLTCERRETAMSPAEITAVTDNPFSLTVNIGPSSFTHPIPPGTTVLYTDTQGARSLLQFGSALALASQRPRCSRILRITVGFSMGAMNST